MKSRRKWYVSREGLTVSYWNVRVALTIDEYEEIRKHTEKTGHTIKQWLEWAASDGILARLSLNKEEPSARNHD